MHSHLLNFSWYLGIVMELVLVGVILGRRALRQWPVMFTYCCWDLVCDALLAANRPDRMKYFMLYWAWFCGSALLRFGLIAEVLASFPGAEFILPTLRKFVVTSGAFLTAACFFAASIDASHAKALYSAAHYLDAAVLLSWGAFVVAMLFCVWIFRLGWSAAGVRVATGITIKAVLGILVAHFFSPQQRVAVGMYVQALGAIGCLVFWFWATLESDFPNPANAVRAVYQNATLRRSSEKVDTLCT